MVNRECADAEATSLPRAVRAECAQECAREQAKPAQPDPTPPNELKKTELRARAHLRYTEPLLLHRGLNSGRIRTGRRGDQPLSGSPEMVRREMAVALHHRQRAPGTEALDVG